MSQLSIDIGIQGNDGTGDSIRESFRKVNTNFTELYAAFGAGGKIGFTNLADAPSAYGNSQVIMSNTTGSKLTARNLIAGSGIVIDTTNNAQVTFSAAAAGLRNDSAPTLVAPINANGFTIGNIAAPSQSLVNTFNTLYGTNITINDLVINKGYADAHYLPLTTTTTGGGTSVSVVTGPVRVRAEPSIPPTTDPDYDPTLTGNYLATEAVQRRAVVLREGDTMTGALVLNDHPSPITGTGPQDSTSKTAATKYYVDQATFASNVNLFVSTSSGDDLQQKAPPGKQGRSWSYSYKTIGAAMLAADSLQSIAQIEPGPYRQRISYTLSGSPTEYFSTINNVALTGGNSAVPGYPDARTLLEQNKTFIQNEVVSYINNKYVNQFSYNQTTMKTNLVNLIDAVCYDLVVGSTYNTTRVATTILAGTGTTSLAQTVDAINNVSSQILNYSYVSANLSSYITSVINGLCYDLIFNSNYQTIQAALAFSTANTSLSTTEIVSIIGNLGNEILGINGTTSMSAASVTTTATGTVSSSTISVSSPIGIVVGMLVSGAGIASGASVTSIVGSTIYLSSANTDAVSGSVVLGSNAITVVNVSGIAVGQNVSGTNIAAGNTVSSIVNNTIILSLPTAGPVSGTAVFTTTSIANNNSSISSNIAALEAMLTTGKLATPVFPAITGTTTTGQTSARDLLLNNISFIQAEVVSFLSANYPGLAYSQAKCKRDVQYIVWALVYDLMYGGNSATINAARTYYNGTLVIAASERQATLDAYDYVNTLAQAIITNTSLITQYQQSIIQYQNTTLLNGGTMGTSIANNIETVQDYINGESDTLVVPSTTGVSSPNLAIRSYILGNSTTYASDAVTYQNNNFPVIIDSGTLATISNLFTVASSLLTNGIVSRTTPTYTLTSASTGYQNAATLIKNNIPFLIDDALGYVKTTYLSYYNAITDTVAYRRQLQYIIEGIIYDIVYGGTSGATLASQLLYTNGTDSQTNAAIITRIQANISSIISTTVAISPNYLSTVSSSNAQYINAGLTGASAASTAITADFTIISTVLGGGTAPTIVYPTLTGFSSTAQSARNTIVPNESNIAQTTILYLNTTYAGGFNYNQATCLRDVGLIIEAMAIDVIVGGTYQSIQAGKSYYRNASALLAIGGQYKETLDGINYAKTLAIQCLNQTTASRYQTAFTQYTNGGLSAASQAVTDVTNNMNTLISIITNGLGSAPAPSYGTGIWNVYITNGGNNAVDQGKPGSNHIIPAKALVGATSGATGVIVTYTPNASSGLDLIQIRLTQPILFTNSEQLDFGETVKAANITVFVESGIYYEDYPLRLPANVSIKGDEFRRTIVRPLDRISQSPWRKVFFYRDAVIDANLIGYLDQTINYASLLPFTGASAIISGTTGNITVTFPSSVFVPSSYIGKVITVGVGQAVISSVSNNIANCQTIYPFSAAGTFTSGNWGMYNTINYGRHYLTNPLDITSTPKNNKLIDVLLCNDQTRVSNLTFQGHGGFAMVLDPEGQIKTKSPYGQVCSSFSQSINAKRFAGGQYVDGFTGRLRGTINAISYNAITGFNTSSLVGGSGYTPTSGTATYTNVALTGGTGSGATGTITVTNGAVVNISVATIGAGTGYTIGDSISCANSSIGGTGSGFSIPVSTVSGNGIYVTIKGSTSATGTYVSGGGTGSNTLLVTGVAGTIQPGSLISGTGYGTGQTVVTVTTSDNVTYTVTTSGYGTTTPSGTLVFGVSSGLDIRPPQPPCAFYVSGFRYQVDDILSFDATTATAVLVLDTATPYNAAGAYNNATCSRDTGLVLDAVGYDVVLGSNYQSVKAGLSYLRQDAYTVLAKQITTTTAAFSYASTLAQAQTSYSSAQTTIANSFSLINTILQQGVASAAPTITYPAGPNSTAGQQNAVAIIQANRTFLQQEITAWLNANYVVKNIPNYSAVVYQQNVGYAVDAICYDLLYGGNSMTFDFTISYFAKSVSTETGFNTVTGQEAVIAASYGRLNTILQQIVLNTTVTKSLGNIFTQNTSLPAATSTEQTSINTLATILTGFNYTTGVTSATRTTPNTSGANTNLLAAQSAIQTARSTIQSSVITFINQGATLTINVEGGGNKSMLANDFAMINDLGYGILATNGGVTEQVSTFSYYCHTHYWANNGGQIRSVAGSNAHGDYGLRSSGYDVTELPNAVNLTYDMAQTARVYKQGTYANTGLGITVDSTKSLSFAIIGYEYTPFNVSEIEIDHTLAGGPITRYLLSTIAHTSVTINGQNVLQLTLATTGINSTSATGLLFSLYDGQLIQIRMLQNAKFYNISNVNPTRPSTALQYTNNLSDVYRLIAYNLTESTGEILPANVAVLQSDASFNYYKLTIDATSIAVLDPQDPTKTQGSKVGDNKIAVLTISDAPTIAQINRGIYVFTWNGRSHRAISYTPPVNIATGYYVSGGGTSPYTITLNNVSGTISAGMLVTGGNAANNAYLASQNITVVSTNLTTTGGLTTGTVVVSGLYNAAPTSGYTITFGVFVNGYLTIDPNPTFNIATYGASIGALTYNSKYVPTVGGTAYVTYDTNLDLVNAPIVDGYYLVANQPNAAYNGYQQVSAVTSTTLVTVGSTVGLSVGQLISAIVTLSNVSITGTSGQFACNTTSLITGTQIQVSGALTGNGSISGYTGITTVYYVIATNNSTTFTLSTTSNGSGVTTGTGTVTGLTFTVLNPPAVYVAPNATITSISSNGYQFTVSPACWFPSGTTVSAQNVATVQSLTISNAGSGYGTTPPTVTFSGGGASSQAIATVTLTNGSVTGFTIVSPGYGYTSQPTITVSAPTSGVTAVLVAVLTANPVVNATAISGISNIQVTMAYPSDPGLFQTGALVAPTGYTSKVPSTYKSNNGFTLTLPLPTQSVAPTVDSYYRVYSYTNIITATTTGTNYITTSSTANLSTGQLIEFNNIDIFTNATAAASGTNYITVNNTTGMAAGMPITFTYDQVNMTVSYVAASGQITVNSSAGLFLGMPIVFSGTAAGGLNPNQTYYIYDAPDSTHIRVTTVNGGAYQTFSNASANMSASAGGIFGGLGQGVVYYINSVVDGTHITVSQTASPLSAFGLSAASGFMKVSIGGGGFGGLTNSTTYYITSIPDSTHFTVSTTLGGTNLVLSTAYGTMLANVVSSYNPLYNGSWAVTASSATSISLFYPYDPGAFITPLNATLSSVSGVSGAGPFLVTFTIPTQAVAPTTGINYTVSGQVNTAFNTSVTATSSSTTSITLSYVTNPGTFVTATPINITSYGTVTGSGPYVVTYNITSQTYVPFTGTTYTVAGSSTAGYNGTYSVVGSTNSTIQVSYPSNPGSFVAGLVGTGQIAGTTLAVTAVTSGAIATNQVITGTNVTTTTVTGTYTTGKLISAVASNATYFTITTAAQPVPWIVGQQVTITGVTPTGYNNTWTISNNIAPTATQFTVTNASNFGTSGFVSNAGTATPSGATGGVGMYVVATTQTAASGAIATNLTITPTATTTSVIGGATILIAPEVTNASSSSLGISKPFSVANIPTLRLGYPAGSGAQITVRISTCRATGHDFLDIGTGGYVTTNYPYQIYGNPALPRQQTQEVFEEGVGRVFYVTSDQNGIFRVGRFFTVDQGTGTVTFSASIALSNLDGLGFKRGVVVSEFSTDSTMTNNASDTVPVQSAVRGYIDARLGLTHGGSPVALTNLIGPGYLALSGALSMKGSLNMSGYLINNVSTPQSGLDAANKSYADGLTLSVNALYKLTDQLITYANIPNGNTHVFDQYVGNQLSIISITTSGGTATLTYAVQPSAPYAIGQTIYVQGVNPSGYNGTWVVTACTSIGVQFATAYSTAYVGGGTITTGRWRNIAFPNSTSANNDVAINWNSSTSALTSSINLGVIVNQQVSPTAAIAQSKLSLNSAGVLANATGITQANLGVAAFSSATFSSTNGWIDVQTSTSASTGVVLSKIQQISASTILGNLGSVAASPSQLTPGNVVTAGDGIKNANFSSSASVSTGVMIVNYNIASGTSGNTYSIIPAVSTATANSIVLRDSSGNSTVSTLNTATLQIGGYKAQDLTSTTFNYYTPGGYQFGTSTGTNGTNSTFAFLAGTVDISASGAILKATTITTGAAGTVGTVTGTYQVTASSTWDVTAGTLKSYTLTTGGDSLAGVIQGKWTLSGASTLQATYADLAEYYEGDQEYEPGTVLVFGGDKEVTTTADMNDTRLAGVVTTNPAYVMNAEQTGIKVCLALAGRVPVKVVGRVKKGDMLTTSSTPGYAVKALNPTLGAIIGKAIEDKDYGEAGVITVAVGRM